MNARELSEVIREIIDALRAEELSESEAKDEIDKLLSERTNRLKIMVDGEYTATFKRVMMKKRLVRFDRLMHKNEM